MSYFSSPIRAKFCAAKYSPGELFLKRIKPGAKVLDIGCGSGGLAQAVLHTGAKVWGVDNDPKQIRKAQKYCNQALCADIETVHLPFGQFFFDVIVMSDVLEHLKRPDLVVKSVKKYLKTDGILCVSVPNIARIEFRLKHLLGKFEYQNDGIMKKDHLRFFTLASIKKMLISEGYSIQKIDYTGLAARVKFAPTLLAFQLVIIAKLNDSH